MFSKTINTREHSKHVALLETGTNVFFNFSLGNLFSIVKNISKKPDQEILIINEIFIYSLALGTQWQNSWIKSEKFYYSDT